MHTLDKDLKAKRLTTAAMISLRGGSDTAGYDLYCVENYVTPVGKKLLMNIDMAIEIPKHAYRIIIPRSELATKSRIDVGAGVVDFNYRSTVKMLTMNNEEEDFPLYHRDRVALN